MKDSSSQMSRFDDFVTRLMAVPHAEIKQQLEDEKKRKQVKSASPSSDESSNRT